MALIQNSSFSLFVVFGLNSGGVTGKIYRVSIFHFGNSSSFDTPFQISYNVKSRMILPNPSRRLTSLTVCLSIHQNLVHPNVSGFQLSFKHPL